MIKFFQEGLKPSIKAHMEQHGQDLDSWDKLVKKAVDVKAKTSLQPTSFIRKMDQRCPRGNHPAHTIAARALTQGLSSMRDPKAEKSKSKPRDLGDELFH